MADDAKREIDYWGHVGADILSHTDFDEAVEYELDDYFGDEDEPGQVPTTITMSGFARMRFTIKTEVIAERIREDLDNFLIDYGDGENWTDLPEKLEKRVRKLAKAVRKHWPVSQCEPVETVEVNAKQWVTENRPDWLKDPRLTFEEDQTEDEDKGEGE